MHETKYKLKLNETATNRPIQTRLPFEIMEELAAAHYVKLKAGSKLPDGRWRNIKPDYQSILKHVDAGGNVGLVPSTVILNNKPLTVLDQDAGQVRAMVAAYPPVAVAPTRDERHHLYYWDTLKRNNGQWRGPGGCSGEVRSANGYAALHGNELTIVDHGLEVALQAEYGGWLPDHLIIAGGRATDGNTNADDSLELAWKLWLDLLNTVKRKVDIGASLGERHVRMVQRLTSWTGRRTWNKQPVTSEYIAGRAVAYWLGLPEPETFFEGEAVGILSWCLANRERIQAQPHTPEFLVTQSVRGKRGRSVPRCRSLFVGTTNEDARPWEAMGVSRATWYYRQAGRHTGPRGRPKLKLD